MNKPPAFQFYPDDFIGGTVTMNHEERGLYILSLCVQWNRGGLSQDEFDRLGSTVVQPSRNHVLSKFQQGSDGFFRNERMELERGKQTAYREAQSSKGQASAKARFNRGSTVVQPSREPEGNSPSPSPSPSPKREEDEPSAPAATLPSLLPLVKEVFDAWNGLAGFPRCLVLSDARRRAVETRLRDAFFASNWRPALEKLAASSFCRGENDRGWRADFDFFVRRDSTAKLMEGKYDNRLDTHSGNGHSGTGSIPAWKVLKNLEDEETALKNNLYHLFEREANPAGVARLTVVREELAKLKGQPVED